MKIIKKIKKVIISAIMAIMLLPKKIFAVEPKEYTIKNAQQYTEILYGVRSPISSIWNISKIFLIPLALIIGFIIYFKKSKSTTKRKVITMIIVLLVVIAICWGVNYLITNL